MTTYSGTFLADTKAMVEEALKASRYICRGCGNKQEECDCPKPDPREALYDDPARGAR